MQALGFPFGRTLNVGRDSLSSVVPEITTTTGTVSSLRADDSGARRFVQVDGNVNPGNSGGPLVNKDGFAVGVIQSRLKDATSIAFAIPIDQVKDFLESHGLDQLMPTPRLRLGGVHRSDAKALAMRLPDGLADVSPVRLRFETDRRRDRDRAQDRSRVLAMDTRPARTGAAPDPQLRASSR